MVEHMVERRVNQGVAVLSARKPTILPVLEEMGVSHRALLMQERGALPAMRPPILLDGDGMSVLDTARVLHNLDAGRMPGWKAGCPIPVVAVVSPLAYAHHHLFACSRSVVSVMATPLNMELFPKYLWRCDVSSHNEHAPTVWFGLSEPTLPKPRPDLATLLVALAGATKMQDAIATCGVSRATFFRRLDTLCDMLELTRPTAVQPADRWLVTLVDALDRPSATQPTSLGSTSVPSEA